MTILFKVEYLISRVTCRVLQVSYYLSLRIKELCIIDLTLLFCQFTIVRIFCTINYGKGVHVNQPYL